MSRGAQQTTRNLTDQQLDKRQRPIHPRTPVRRSSLLRPHHGPRSQRQRNLFCRSCLSVRTTHARIAIQLGDHGHVVGFSASQRSSVAGGFRRGTAGRARPRQA
jgi:hypothetical protein